jgi:putative intracellular protease/amidase
MSRRIIVIAALCIAPAVLASDGANDRICTRDAVVRPVSPRPAIAAAFANKPAQVVVEDGLTAPMGPTEVVVARIGADGKVVMSCVDTPEAAERFFRAARAARPEKNGTQEQ